MQASRLLLLCALLLAGSARAATYAVPGDFATIQAALDAALAGDTINVASGTYFEKLSFPRSGSAGSFITLQAAPSASPVLDGTGVAGADMVRIESRSYVRLIGFEIRNNLNVNDGSGVRVLGSGSFIEIRNNRIHDMRGRSAMGITVYASEAAPIDQITIDGNEIHDCDPAPSEALTLNGNVTGFAVTNNVVRDVNNIGIDFIGGETDIQPDPALVARNGVCRGNCVLRARSSYGGGYAGGIYVDGGKDIVIENNVVSESDLGIEIGAENGGVVTSNITVRNNVVHHNEKAGLVFGGYAASTGRVKRSRFLNNTAYANDTLGVGLGELWIQYAEDNTVSNNVFRAGGGGVLLYSENGNLDNVLSYNVWFAAAPRFVWQGTAYTSFAAYQSGSGQDASSTFADPQLVAPEAGDFHLRATSPAVNAGDPLFVPAAGETDMDGAPRVSGARVDAGADEVGCGNGVVDPGESCDDGDLVDCNGCDSNCTPSAVCGNRVVCGSEQCDDGNTAAGDCCSALCRFETAGAPCSDGNGCTFSDACDGSGLCAGDATPLAGCRQPAAGAGSLTVKDSASDARDLLVWRWVRGDETLPGALGDPRAATDYTLCLYDEGPGGSSVALFASLPAGPLWDPTASGVRFVDSQGLYGGVQRLVLVSGAAGSARFTLRARGLRLATPSLPFVQTPKVTAQLHNSDGECWQSTFTAPAVVTGAGRFRDRAD